MKNIFYFFIFCLAGCQSVFFYPSSAIVWTPENAGFRYEVHSVPVDETNYFTLWQIKPEGEQKGTILYLHGNAENNSTHTQSVMWLVNEGYQIFALDYRGFGESSGAANVVNAAVDIQKSVEYVNSKIDKEEKLILFAQSIGASVSIFALANHPLKNRFSLFIFESGFTSYQGIAKEKLSEIGLFYPLNSIFSLLATDCCDPLLHVHKFPAGKVIFAHNKFDPVVHFHNSEDFYEACQKPNLFWQSESEGHGTFFAGKGHRERLLQKLDSVVNR